MNLPRILFSFAALAVALPAQCLETQVGSSIGTGDDVVLPMQSLGFAFPFGGTTYTNVHVSTNGLVYLSNAGTPSPGGSACCTGNVSILTGGAPMIAPYWNDLVVSATYGGAVRFNALPGKAVITWENAYEFGATSELFSFQLQLSASGDIGFSYGGNCIIRTVGDFLIGMSEGGGATIPAASDFSVAGASATTTNFETFNTTALTFDLTGKWLLFTPNGTGYSWSTQACAATSSLYGAGCYSVSDSLYQRFPDAAQASAALTGQSISFTASGSTYVATWGAKSYVAPVAAAPVFITPTDDGETTITPSIPFPTPEGPQATLRVHSNGVVSWGAAPQTFPTTQAYVPTGAGCVNGANGGFYSWHDFNESEAGSGRIVAEEMVTGGGETVLYVTWDNVENYSNPPAFNPSTMQMQFNLTNGDVAILWPAIDGDPSSVWGSGHLVGYSPAGASVDAGSTSLATALPLLVPTSNQYPLGLSAASRPVAGTVVDYTTVNIPEAAPGSSTYISMAIFSFGQLPAPGVDLVSLGAPGCASLIASIDVPVSAVTATNSSTISFLIPAGTPGGASFYTQSISLFAPNSLPNGQNAFGLTTSNGIESVVGLW